MRRLPIFQLILVAVLAFAGGAAFLDVFTPSDLVPWLLGAALLPVLVALALRVVRRPHLAVATAVDLVVFVVFVGVSLFRSTTAASLIPTGATLSAIVEGVRGGWAEILSSTVPAPARPTSLFVPVALTWLAAFVGAEMACRTRRVFMVLVPGVAVGIGGMLFAEQAWQTSWWAMVALVAAAAVLLAVRSSAFAGDPRPFDQREETLIHERGSLESEASWALWRQRVFVAVPFVMLVAFLAPLVARALPFVDSNRQILLRDRFVVPVERSQDLNPLTNVAAVSGSDAVRFRVRTDVAVQGKARFATNVLDRFDGVQWSSSSEYVTVGARMPGAVDAADKVKSVQQDFEVVAPEGPQLPALQRAVALDAPDDLRVQADPGTGALVVIGSPGQFRYSVISEVGDYKVEDIVSAGVATIDSARAAVTKTDQLPPDLLKLRDEVMGPGTSPFAQLARLLAFFHNDERVNKSAGKFKPDPSASSGFTTAEVTQFLKGDGTRTGRPELFAASFATLARSQGFPARVVVGYVPKAAVTAGEQIELRDSDLTAWVEVALDGFGWVAFDPSPDDAATSQNTVEEQQLDSLVSQSVDNSQNNDNPRPAENPNANPVPSQPEEGNSARVISVLAVLLLAVLVTLTVILGPWWRKRRRAAARRGAPDPADRVAGAWLEAMDRLAESDVPNPTTLTVDQAAAAADEKFGAQHAAPLRELGPLVNRALHAADPPAADAAAQAWQLSDTFAAEVRKTQSRSDRVRASLDRRPIAASSENEPPKVLSSI